MSSCINSYDPDHEEYNHADYTCHVCGDDFCQNCGWSDGEDWICRDCSEERGWRQCDQHERAMQAAFVRS